MPPGNRTASAMASPGGRRERKRLQTIDHIADIAWEMFQTQGVEAVTMEAVAEAADVSKGTLYKYFPEKGALLRRHIHREMAVSLPTVMAHLSTLPTATDRLRKYFYFSSQWGRANRELVRPFTLYQLAEAGRGERRDTDSQSVLEQILGQLITAGQENGEFRREIDAASAARYLSFLTLAAVLRWLESSELDLYDEYLSMLDLLLLGLSESK